jgi:xanthine dehydrogenase large subunit
MAGVTPDRGRADRDSAANNATAGTYSSAGVLETALVIAPYAHALIEAIDVKAALDLEGVHAVLTARDIPGENRISPEAGQFPLFAEDCVFYHSQPVAAVIAENSSIAKEAAGLVQVKYKPRIPVVGIDEAIALNSFHGEEQVLQRAAGEAADGQKLGEFAKEFTIAGHDYACPEDFCSLAEPGKKGGISITVPEENRGLARSILAQLLGREKSMITFKVEPGGNSFGRSAGNLMMPAIAALAVIKIGLPVRVAPSCESGLRLRPRQNPVQVRINASYDSDACIHDLDCMVYIDGGWQADGAQSVLHHILHHIDGAYVFPRIRASGRLCRTNCLSSAGTSLNGKAIAALVIEEMISGVALCLKMKPESVRERNLYSRGGDRLVPPFGQDTQFSAPVDAWQRVKEISSHEKRAREIDEWNKNSSSAKRGLAVVPVKVGCGISLEEAEPVQADVCLLADGTAQVTLDGIDSGRTLCIYVADILEEELGVCRDTVSIVEGDANHTVPSGHDELYGEALIDACHQLRDKLRIVAAGCLDASGVEISDIMELRFSKRGVCDPDRPDTPVELSVVTAKAMAEGMELSGSGKFNADNVPGGRPFRHFACGAASAEVMVDGYTGEIRILRVDLVHEPSRQGRAVFQSLIGSSFMSGTGWLTCDPIHWTAHGEIMTSGLGDMQVSGAMDVPLQFQCEALAGDGRRPKDPGEVAFCLAISVREAIRDAIVAFGGVKPRFHLSHPLSPESVYFSIEASDC